jgi:indolepyruvate ferredoxin oxidoreductase, beta subunit
VSEARDRPIKIAVLAMGGQGGGVLTDWIVGLAELQGWFAQSTSVPGVAQRTGATVYYIEMMPASDDGRAPILSLMPSPGDVDIVLAAEFMEAGRSMLRGLVTPERTTLIASTHRSLAMSEKESPGDGIVDGASFLDAAGVAAKRAILFDMQSIADRDRTVISAALFGALAGAEVLPFPRDAFEAAVRQGGRGAAASLRAFAVAFDLARDAPPRSVEEAKPEEDPRAAAGHPELDRLVTRMEAEFPSVSHRLVFAGLRRLVDFQDVAYADEYLDRLAAFRRLDDEQGGSARGYALTIAAAKYLAVAMAYDDVIRVADLKTRSSRFARIDAEIGRQPDQILYMTEFMHPRMEEVLATFPAGFAKWLEARPSLIKRFDRFVNRGRRVRTGTITWFLSLYLLSALKPMRRRLLRHEREMHHIGQWVELATLTARRDYDLAVEIVACRRLVKGYSDTHARGMSKFDRILAIVPFLQGKPDSAGWLRRLRNAALADEEGQALDGALRTVHSAFDLGDVKGTEPAPSSRTATATP